MRRTTPLLGLVLGLGLLALGTIVPRDAAAASRTWLGVYTQEITNELRDGLDLHGADGVLVNQVVSGSPAAEAGLRKGDVITSFNSRSVDSPEALASMVRSSNDGREVALGIVRDGDKRTLSVTLGNRSDDDEEDSTPPAAPEPPRAPRAPRAPREARDYKSDGDDSRELRVQVQGKDGDRKVRVWKNGEEVDPDEMGDLHIEGLEGLKGLDGLKGLKGLEKLKELKHLDGDDHMKVFGSPDGDGQMRMMLPGGRGRLGVRIQSLNEDLASAVGAAGSHGALVLEVLKGTPAEAAGLRSGDVITEVEGQSIDEAGDLAKALRDQDGKVTLTIIRKGMKRTIEAELEDSPRSMHMDHGDGMSGMGRSGGEAPRVMIRRPLMQERGDQDELRKQVDELREQLRELRRQLEDRK